MLIVLCVVVLVVESFPELFITIRAASGSVPSSSIRRCPSGGSSSSQGASCVFAFLMVGSMIVISLACEGSRFARRKPSWFSCNRRRRQRLRRSSRASSCSSCSSSLSSLSSPSPSSSSRFARRAASCPRRRFGAAPAAAAAAVKALPASSCSSWTAACSSSAWPARVAGSRGANRRGCRATVAVGSGSGVLRERRHAHRALRRCRRRRVRL